MFKSVYSENVPYLLSPEKEVRSSWHSDPLMFKASHSVLMGVISPQTSTAFHTHITLTLQPHQ